MFDLDLRPADLKHVRIINKDDSEGYYVRGDYGGLLERIRVVKDRVIRVIRTMAAMSRARSFLIVLTSAVASQCKMTVPGVSKVIR